MLNTQQSLFVCTLMMCMWRTRSYFCIFKRLQTFLISKYETEYFFFRNVYVKILNIEQIVFFL